MLGGKGVPSTPPSEVRICIYMYVTSLKIHLYVYTKISVHQITNMFLHLFCKETL